MKSKTVIGIEPMAPSHLRVCWKTHIQVPYLGVTNTFSPCFARLSHNRSLLDLVAHKPGVRLADPAQ
jgi:hypothetical protein